MSLLMLDEAVPHGALAIWWLGQAGFAFKSPAGKIVYLDPYLSDAVERLHGFKRLSLPAITAEEVRADLVVLTHEHTDHLDPDAVPIIARNNPGCRFAAPEGCTQGLIDAGVPPVDRFVMAAQQRYELDSVVIHTVPADHGDFSPSALCMVCSLTASASSARATRPFGRNCSSRWPTCVPTCSCPASTACSAI